MPTPLLLQPQARSQLVRMPTVVTQTGLSKSEIYRRIGEGTFPRPAKLGYRTAVWSADEVARWVDARIAERDSGKPA